MTVRTLRELIDALEEAAEEYGDEAPVAFAHQWNHPLMLGIDHVVKGVKARKSRYDDEKVLTVFLREPPDASNDYAPSGVYGDAEDDEELCDECEAVLDEYGSCPVGH